MFWYMTYEGGHRLDVGYRFPSHPVSFRQEGIFNLSTQAYQQL